MRSSRLTIGASMAVVAFVAISTAALRSPSNAWTEFYSLATCSVLMLAAIAGASRQGRHRARPLAFAAFGLAYLVLCLCIDLPPVRIPTALYTYFDPPPPSVVVAQNDWGCSGCQGFQPGLPFHDLIGHCLVGLAAASLAGLIAPLLLTKDDSMGADRPSPHNGRRWLPPAVTVAIAIAGLGITAFGLGRAPGPTAAGAQLATGGGLILALIAAVSHRGHRRAALLGFALFGTGYLTLALGPRFLPPSWPKFAGDRIIDSTFSLLPHTLSSQGSNPTDPLGLADVRIRQALDRTISLQLKGEITLETFVERVRQVAIAQDNKPIPIHVSPQGLMNVDRTMKSPLTVDFDDVHLQSMLRLALEQLSLTYYSIDGVLVITSNDEETRDTILSTQPAIIPAPYRVVGHCLLALIASCSGGLLARLFGGPRREPSTLIEV